MTHTTTPVSLSARRGRLVVKRWQGELVGRVVHDALASRDFDDPESVTEATHALLAGVETLLERPLTDYETTRFRRLAARAKPSEIIPLVHRLNGGIKFRWGRTLQMRSDVSELIWG